MSRHADAPLKKITLNIYEEDHTLLKTIYGQGYTEQIRQWIKEKADTWRTDYDRG